MTHSVSVAETLDYYLDSEVATPTWDDEHLTFVDDYEPTHDEDGYNPPKFLVLDGAIYHMARDALVSAKLWEKFRAGHCVNAEQHDDVGLETIYTSPVYLGSEPLPCLKIVGAHRRGRDVRIKGKKNVSDVPVLRKHTLYTVRVRKSRRCKKLTTPHPLTDDTSEHCESCDSDRE